MGKLYTTITALLLAVGVIHAAPPSGYEWWFDNDISSVQTGSISGDKEEFTIDVSSLPKGMHRFNCRLNTVDGEYGSIYSKYFYTVSNKSGAKGYEYWFDNRYSSKVTGTISENTLTPRRDNRSCAGYALFQLQA